MRRSGRNLLKLRLTASHSSTDIGYSYRLDLVGGELTSPPTASGLVRALPLLLLECSGYDIAFQFAMWRGRPGGGQFVLDPSCKQLSWHLGSWAICSEYC